MAPISPWSEQSALRVLHAVLDRKIQEGSENV